MDMRRTTHPDMHFGNSIRAPTSSLCNIGNMDTQIAPSTAPSIHHWIGRRDYGNVDKL